MNRLSALLLVLLAMAVPVAGQSTTGFEMSGAYVLHFRLHLASTLPDGVTITCRARIVPKPSLQRGEAPTSVPVETATGVATVNGTLANCAVEIPFSWSVRDAGQGVWLSYEIVAIALTGPTTTEVRTSARQGIGLTYPARGGTTSLNLDATF